MPKHDKALLEAICKHGIGRTDLIVEDPELPFYHVKQALIEDGEETEGEDDEKKSESRFVWPRDLVVFRRIDSLCDLVLNPKPLTIRQTRKRKVAAGTSVDGRKKVKSTLDTIQNNEEVLSEEEMDEEDEEEEEEEGAMNQVRALSSPAADDYSELSHEESSHQNNVYENTTATTTTSYYQAENSNANSSQTAEVSFQSEAHQYQAADAQQPQYHVESHYVERQHHSAADADNQHADYQVESKEEGDVMRND